VQRVGHVRRRGYRRRGAAQELEHSSLGRVEGRGHGVHPTEGV
jgi:hypothetical protein